jgi:FxsC-like protein
MSVPAHREQPVHADEPYFFLAYPHTPEQPWVERLYLDLCREVLERSTLSSVLPLQKVGFMDVSGIRVGGSWRHEVADALARCRTFVPLYSPRYFLREECGKEWHAFMQRVLDHTARHNGRPAAIIPALWLPVEDEDMPLVARDVQCDHRLLGQVYAEEGFYTLIKNSAYSEHYLTAVQRLAKLIIRAANSSGLRPGPAEDYTMLRNVFVRAAGSTPAVKRVTVTVAAPTVGQLPAGRNPAHYGPSALDWNPYFPDTQQSLADTAVEVARMCAYETTIATLDEGYDTLMAQDAGSGLGVLLVDAFAVDDPMIAAKLSTFDKLDKSWVGTLVPWSRQDPQLQTQGERLRAQLHKVLGRRLTEIRLDRPLAVNGVPTLADFRAKLPLVLDTAQARFVNEAPAYPPVGDQPPQPRLTRPASRPWPEQDHPAHGAAEQPPWRPTGQPPGAPHWPAKPASHPPSTPPDDAAPTEGGP